MTTVSAIPRVVATTDGRRSVTSVLTVAVPAALALVLSLAWSGRPSFWLDETATVSAVNRPFPDLLRALKHIDAVHGVYYVLLWPWAQVSTGEVWLRLTSALAAAGGTAAVVAIAWQLLGRWAAAVSGLLYATLPLVSYDGSNVRSESLDVLLTGAATFFLLRAIVTCRRRWLVTYTLVMAFAVTVFLFSALILIAHLALILMSSHRKFIAALITPVAATLVVGALTFGQAAQVSQIQRPTARGLPHFVSEAWFSGSLTLSVVLGVLTASGIVLGRRCEWRVRGSWLVLVLGLGAPTAALWLISQFRPLLVDRYVAAGEIPIAIFAGSVITSIRWRPIAAMVLLAIVAAGLPAQVAQRQPNGRGADYRDDPRAAFLNVAANRQPGDVIAYDGGYTQGAGLAYADLVGNLPDETLGRSSIQAQNLYGTPAPLPVFRKRLTGARRVWLVSYTSRSGQGGAALVRVLRSEGFTRLIYSDYGRTSLSLYGRRGETVAQTP